MQPLRLFKMMHPLAPALTAPQQLRDPAPQAHARASVQPSRMVTLAHAPAGLPGSGPPMRGPLGAAPGAASLPAASWLPSLSPAACSSTARCAASSTCCRAAARAERPRSPRAGGARAHAGRIYLLHCTNSV